MGKKAFLRTTIAFVVALVTGITPKVYGAAGDKLWGDTFYLGSSSDKVQSTLVAIDHQGNIIAASTSKLGDTTYRLYVVSFDKNHSKLWSRTFEGRSAVRPVVDSSDNVIVAYLPNDQKYWVVVSLSPQGQENWTKAVSLGSLDDNCYYNNYCGDTLGKAKALSDMEIDHHDNIVVAGMAVDSEGDYAGRVVSLSSSGTKNWDRYFKKVSRTGEVEGFAKAVAIDGHDNVLVTGSVYNGRNYDIYLVSYSKSGLVNWTYTYAGEKGGNDWGHDIAADHNNNAIAVGCSYEGPSGSSVSENEYWRIFHLSPSGILNWQIYYTEEGNPYGGGAHKVVIDNNNSIKVLGKIASADPATSRPWRIVSYSSSGEYQWTAKLRSEEYNGNPVLRDIAVDNKNNLFGVGYWKTNSSGTFDIRVVCLDSDTGLRRWLKIFDYGNDDYGDQLAIDPTTGDVAVVGHITNGLMAQLLYLEGYQQPVIPERVLKAGGEVRTISSQLDTCDASQGRYLGFGDAATGGDTFKVEAEFPQYIDQQTGGEIPVKIFVAAQLPDDYSRLAYFDTYNNLYYQPPERLSSWISSVTGGVYRTTIYPETTVGSVSWVPTGKHYWYTLVVPDTVPDDFAGVDWSATPWEITVSVFDVK